MRLTVTNWVPVLVLVLLDLKILHESEFRGFPDSAAGRPLVLLNKEIANMGMFQTSEKKRDAVLIDNQTGVVMGLAKTGVAVAGAGAASVASAAAVDLTTLTTAIDFSTTTTAVLGVAAALIVVYIAWKAAKMVISALRGM